MKCKSCPHLVPHLDRRDTYLSFQHHEKRRQAGDRPETGGTAASKYGKKSLTRTRSVSAAAGSVLSFPLLTLQERHFIIRLRGGNQWMEALMTLGNMLMRSHVLSEMSGVLRWSNLVPEQTDESFKTRCFRTTLNGKLKQQTNWPDSSQVLEFKQAEFSLLELHELMIFMES